MMETIVRTVIAVVLAVVFSFVYVWIYTSWLGYPNPSKWEHNLLFFILLLSLLTKRAD
jgi:hypothetical protein